MKTRLQLGMRPRTVGNGLRAFDPALPEDDALIIASVLRDQFNGLDADIQTRATAAALAATASSLNADIQTRVTQPQLDAAANNAVGTAVNAVLPQTSANSNGVGTLGQSADGSYNQTQMQDVLNKLDELINALRR